MGLALGSRWIGVRTVRHGDRQSWGAAAEAAAWPMGTGQTHLLIGSCCPVPRENACPSNERHTCTCTDAGCAPKNHIHVCTRYPLFPYLLCVISVFPVFFRFGTL